MDELPARIGHFEAAAASVKEEGVTLEWWPAEDFVQTKRDFPHGFWKIIFHGLDALEWNNMKWSQTYIMWDNVGHFKRFMKRHYESYQSIQATNNLEVMWKWWVFFYGKFMQLFPAPRVFTDTHTISMPQWFLLLLEFPVPFPCCVSVMAPYIQDPINPLGFPVPPKQGLLEKMSLFLFRTSLTLGSWNANIDRCPVEAELPKSATEVGNPGWVLTAWLTPGQHTKISHKMPPLLVNINKFPIQNRPFAHQLLHLKEIVSGISKKHP